MYETLSIRPIWLVFFCVRNNYELLSGQDLYETKFLENLPEKSEICYSFVTWFNTFVK